MMLRVAVAAAVVGLAAATTPTPATPVPAPKAPVAPKKPDCKLPWGGDLTGLSPHRFVDSNSYFLISGVQKLTGAGYSNYEWQFSGCNSYSAPKFMGQPGCPTVPTAYGYQYTKKGNDMYDCEVGWDKFLGDTKDPANQAITYSYEAFDTKRSGKKTLEVTVKCDPDKTEMTKYIAQGKVARLDPDVVAVKGLPSGKHDYDYQVKGVLSVCACKPANAPGGKLPTMCAAKDNSTPKDSPIPPNAYQYKKSDCSGDKLRGVMYGVYPFNANMPQVYWPTVTAQPTQQNYYWSMGFCQPTTVGNTKYTGCGLLDGDGLLEQYNEAGQCMSDFEWAPRDATGKYKVSDMAYANTSPTPLAPTDYGCGDKKTIDGKKINCPTMTYKTPGIKYQIFDPSPGHTPRYAFVYIRCDAAGSATDRPKIDPLGPTIETDGKPKPIVTVQKNSNPVNGQKKGFKHYEYNFFLTHKCACAGACTAATNKYTPETEKPVSPSVTDQCDKVVDPDSKKNLWVINPDITARRQAAAATPPATSFSPVIQKATDPDKKLTSTYSIYFFPCLGNKQVPDCPGAVGSLLALKSSSKSECDSFRNKPIIKVLPKGKMEFTFHSKEQTADPNNPKAPAKWHTHIAHINVECDENVGPEWVANPDMYGTKKEYSNPDIERWHFYFKSSCACPGSKTCTQPNWTPSVAPSAGGVSPKIVPPNNRPAAPSFKPVPPVPAVPAPVFVPIVIPPPKAPQPMPVPVPVTPVPPVPPVPMPAPVPVTPVPVTPVAPVPLTPVTPVPKAVPHGSPPKAKADSGGLGSGAVAGIIIGVLAVLALAAGAGFFVWKKKSSGGFEEIN